MRIVLVANDTTFIYNLRREILKGLIAEGHEVSVMCQVLQFKEELEQMGCGVIDIETAHRSLPEILSGVKKAQTGCDAGK